MIRVDVFFLIQRKNLNAQVQDVAVPEIASQMAGSHCLDGLD